MIFLSLFYGYIHIFLQSLTMPQQNRRNQFEQHQNR